MTMTREEAISYAKYTGGYSMVRRANPKCWEIVRDSFDDIKMMPIDIVEFTGTREQCLDEMERLGYELCLDHMDI